MCRSPCRVFFTGMSVIYISKGVFSCKQKIRVGNTFWGWIVLYFFRTVTIRPLLSWWQACISCCLPSIQNVRCQFVVKNTDHSSEVVYQIVFASPFKITLTNYPFLRTAHRIYPCTNRRRTVLRKRTGRGRASQKCNWLTTVYPMLLFSTAKIGKMSIFRLFEPHIAQCMVVKNHL